MNLSPLQFFGLILVVSIALYAFFHNVELTQKQAVISMFGFIGAGFAVWFWARPWK